MDLGAAAVEIQHTMGVTKATKEVDFKYMHDDGVIFVLEIWKSRMNASDIFNCRLHHDQF